MAKAAPRVASPRFTELELSPRALRWKFQRTTLEAALPKSGQVLEIGLSRLEDLAGKPAAALSGLAHIEALWNDEARSAFERAQQRLNKTIETGPSCEAACVPILWPAGHRLHFVGLPENTATFDLHEQLREQLAPLLKPVVSASASDAGAETSQLRIHLLSLSHERQKEVLEAIAYLLATLPWKAHRFQAAKAKSAKKSAPADTLDVQVTTSLESTVAQACVQRGTILGRANSRVRTLADLPANVLNPRDYRAIAEQMARAQGLKTTFLDTKSLDRLGAGAFLAVARADLDGGAGILKIRYAPARARKHVALVGKGICFDTGGYNIKTGGFMHGMHGDMTGSALALALVCAVAEMKLPITVTAYLGLAENLISPTAYKPNEVVTACDGTTIEVVDTDAEGRMLLSDTLALARREKADLCLDFATLTGAAIRALDKRIGAIFSNDTTGSLLDAALTAGRDSGERVWAFPCGGDYKKGLKSEVADLLQCSSSSYADHIYAATFLSHFIGDETPWVHLDLTPATSKGGLGLIESTTTGFGVRWATSLIERQLGGRSKK